MPSKKAQKNHITGHECSTVPEAGWSGKKNGELLSLAEHAGFKIFLTLDRGIEYEQNLKGREIAIICLAAKSNRLSDIAPEVSRLLPVLGSGIGVRTRAASPYS